MRTGIVADLTEAEEVRSESWFALRRLEVFWRAKKGRVAGLGVLDDRERREPSERKERMEECCGCC